MPDSRTFTAERVRKLLVSDYDPISVARGAGYARDGRVDDIAVEPFEDGWSVTAFVKGSRRQPYLVELVLLPEGTSDLTLDQFCSCPVGVMCKHGVAVLEILAREADRWFGGSRPTPPDPDPAFRRKPRQSPPPPSTSPSVRTSVLPPTKPVPTPGPRTRVPVPAPAAVPRLDPALTSWLDRLTVAPTPPEAAGTSANAGHPVLERLVFILKLRQRQLIVEPGISRRLKSGGWGSPAITTWESLLRPDRARPATPEDQRLVRELALDQSSPYNWAYVLSAATGPGLLSRLVATDRCYWMTAGKLDTPLRSGAPRTAEPRWEVQPDGSQHPRLAVSPPVSEIIPFRPLWYVDRESHECGPLETQLEPRIALAWLDAPPVAADQAADVAAALEPHAPRLAVPLPKAVAIEWIRDLSPVPVLTLFAATLPHAGPVNLWDYPRPDPRIALARLEFEYDGLRIHSAAPASVLQTPTATGFRRYVRNEPEEARAMDELEHAGLVPADESMWDLEFGESKDDYLAESDADWIAFVEGVLPKLQAAGWQIVIEPDFPWRLVRADSWFMDAEAGENSGDGPQQDWFGVELGAVVDGVRVNLLPLLVRLLAHDRSALDARTPDGSSERTGIPLTLADGRTLLFPADRARTILDTLVELFDPQALDGDGRLRLGRLRAAELAGEADWRWLGPRELAELAARFRDFRGLQPVPPPAGLKAELRAYQQEGLNWLQFLREHELGGILADDMGLGKTVQTLAHLLVEKESGRADLPSLVVAPTSLMTNWRQEAERFAPALRVLVLHGLDRHDHFDRIRDHDLVLTTYPLLPRDLATLREHRFHCLILDEAQFIKNPRTGAARSAVQLNARHRLCLTGTPMENHLGELWSLFYFLLPGFLGDPLSFQRVFRHPIEKLGDAGRREALARRVRPFLLRRRKEEVARDLPAKNEIIQRVELAGAQRDLYESVRLAMNQRVQEEVAKKGFSRAHIVILDALLKLRQICCHPALLDLPSARKVKESAKLELLFELLPSMIDEGRRVLLFSQFTSMLALIEAELRARAMPYVLLTGDTTDRATPVRRFQAGEVPLFLISLKAGGTGLNLTAADTVIHYDPWWNPAVENQATDRAHRIGQDKQVFVYKLLTAGTVEEKIAALQARKAELVAGLLDSAAAGKLQLTHADLESLFEPVG